MNFDSDRGNWIRSKAFDWVTSNDADGLFIKLGWKPVFVALDSSSHFFWAKLFERLDPPANLYGLRSVLAAIDWMASDLAQSFPSKSSAFKQVIVDIDTIKKYFEGQEDSLFSIYEANDFFGILTKHPMYSLLMSIKGDQTQFSQYAAYPISWLLVFLADPIEDASRLYTINKEFRRIASELSLTVIGTDDFSENSIIVDVLNEVLNVKKAPESEYNRFFEQWGLKSALKIIRQTAKLTHERSGTGYGGKVFGAKVIGRNNQVSAIQGKYKNIPVESYSEDVGEFKLTGFVNNSVFEHKEPSLKVLEPVDHTLTTMIQIPMSALKRSRNKRKTRTSQAENELDNVKRKVNARFLGDSTIRANQHFITNTSTLDDYTIEVLIIELQNWYQSEFELKRTKYGIHPTIAVAVLATCLFFGKSLEKVIVSVRKNALNKAVDGYFISQKSDGISGHWLLETPLAGLVKNNTMFEHTEEVNNAYRLPMPLWLTQIMLQTEDVKNDYVQLDLIEEERTPTLKRLGFVWTISEYEKEYELFFSKLRKKYHGIELNLRLVEQYLLNASLHDYDVVYSAYFTNKRTIFSHTQLFYTRIKEQVICSKFAEFWDLRLNALSLKNNVFHGLNLWPKLNDKRYIGSALVPQKLIVEQVVLDLQNTLTSQQVSGLTSIVLYHQIYTIYTMVFLSYATGYRGVHNLLPSWRLISENYEWLAISDKDDKDASHTRLVFLAPLVREQLQLYKRHLNAFLNKVLLLDFDLYQTLIDTLRDWDLKLDYRNSSERFSDDNEFQGAFFIIDGEKKLIQPISLNYYFDYLNKTNHIELPANGGRHLIRTEGLSAGVPSDVLDSFLGHFIYGKEPHSAYSALGLQEVELGMERFLPSHLKSLGFTAIKSKLLR